MWGFLFLKTVHKRPVGDKQAQTDQLSPNVLLFSYLESLLAYKKKGFMKLLSSTEFFTETMGGRPSKMDMSNYEGHPFECACGKTHIYYSDQVDVLRELHKMKLVFQCPDEPIFITCVKVKGIFRFKGFEGLFGAKIE